MNTSTANKSKAAKSPTRTARLRGGSLERREKQKQQLKQSILDAASELFLEKGYEEFSLRQVAERIGYSPTTIYLHFQNKDDLLLAAVTEGFRGFDRHMIQTAAATPEPLQRIRALGRAYIQFGFENPALYRLMFMQRSDFFIMPRLIDELNDKAESDDTKIARDEAELHITARDLLTDAVREAMKARTIQKGDARIIADALWAAVHGLVSLANSPLLSDGHANRVVEPLLDMLLKGLRR